MPIAIPFRIETHEVATSTQDLMRERLESGENIHGLVIRALVQTGGRGQRKRDWQAGPGGSYQTLAVRDREPSILNKPFAAVVIGIGLAQALPEYGIQVGIKWPNDLYYRDKKVGGILCEYVKGHLLIGAGVNVNNDVPHGAAALRGLDPEGVSNFVLAGLQQGLELLTGDLDLPAAFAPFDVLTGKAVEVIYRGDLVRGVARGISSDGCLLLEHAQGSTLVCQGEARSALSLS